MIVQGSAEWMDQRRGKVTASRIADVMARTKSGYGASRKNYMAQMVVEIMTGQTQDSYQNAAMLWGIETEPEAREAYEFFTGNEVELAEFVIHPEIPDSGASPDGYVGDDGLVEIKCPNTATHIETLLSQKVEGKYYDQMQWQMACAGRKWCDFVSYDPRMPAELCLFVRRINRDDKQIAEIQTGVTEFLQELAEMVASLNKLRESK